jgi:hypothetical protein
MPENNPNSSDKAAKVKNIIFQNRVFEFMKAKTNVTQIILPYRINRIIGLIEKQLVKNNSAIKMGEIFRNFEINCVFSNWPIKYPLSTIKAIII